VPQQDKSPISVKELPNPDLNPLLNPTLGRNLGRWAEVYFTSPPEKREEAVEELLRELQGTPSNPVSSDQGTAEVESVPQAVEPNPFLQICGRCGQNYATPQRFCGMCGTALLANNSELDSRPQSETTHSQRNAETLPLRYAPTSSLLGLDEPILDSSTPFEDSSDIRWLRDKHLASGEDGDRPSTMRRFAPALLAALAIAALFYAQWKPSQTPSRQATQSATAAATLDKTSEPPPKPNESAKGTPPVAAPQSPAQPPVASQPQASAPAAAAATSVQAPPEASRPLASMEAPRPQPSAKPVTPSLPPPVATSDFGNGATELAQAEDYMNGKNGSRDNAAAARLLWQAVGKENTSAILLLSNMYMIGEGVPKNCDQARVLLYAAARKHVVQAADKLRDLERSGCP
jgi:hypothetical protein